MTPVVEETAASVLHHRVSFKEAELVELSCFSVITQRALGQIYVADTNAFPLLPLSLPTHTHVQTVSQRSAMCLQYGRSRSHGLCFSPHLRGNGTLGCLSAGIVLPLPHISLRSQWCIHISSAPDILINHSGCRWLIIKERETSEVYNLDLLCFCSPLSLCFRISGSRRDAREKLEVNITYSECESIFAQ